MNPFVSVLIPSRGRPEGLIHTMRSIYDTASDARGVEILVRLDSDDISTLHRFADVTALASLVLVGERGEGYKNMALFWNQMAGAAQGQWLFFLNDDALLMTDGWDAALKNYADPICLVGPKDSTTAHGWIAFPVVPREVYLRLGRITRFCGVDSWLNKILIQPGRFPVYRTDDIFVQHNRPDLPGHEHRMDRTFIEGRVGLTEYCRAFDADVDGVWKALAQSDIDRLGYPT